MHVPAPVATFVAAALLAAGLMAGTPATGRAAGPKVAILVGPTAITDSTYLPFATNIAAAARAAGATVDMRYCATPADALAATAGASIIVYLGHGSGYPNPYSAVLDPNVTNGWGLRNPAVAWAGRTAGCTDRVLKYYGESWVGANVKPAAGFAMIYSNACYAPGAGENEAASPASEQTALARVAYYSRTILRMGGTYYATDLWQGSAKLTQLLLTQPTTTYGDIFKAGNGFSPGVLRRFVHPQAVGDQVWMQRTPDYAGTIGYWYAFAGNPAASVANPNAPPPPAPVNPVARYSGSDRFATAASISAASYPPGVPTAYVATGFDFPDALAAGSAAAATGAPLLLVGPSAVPAATAAELTRLTPGRIVLVGSAAAVSESVRLMLARYTPGGSVVRIGSADRYQTAAAVSAASFSPGVPVAYLATGTTFPDALAAAPMSGRHGGPVLLVDPAGLPAVTATELARLRPASIVILGGTGAVPDAVAAAAGKFTVGSVTRLAGADRFGTAIAISVATYSSASTVFIANGMNYPDALAGGPAAARAGAPLLLVSGSSIPVPVQQEIKRLGATRAVVLGGTAVVTDSVLQQLQGLLAQ
ncbi:MAG: cell wall-binding repeat-containing protein [Chloroflexota bacterium]|nr:cell wall-binding repeat-containing protein [Chloroflexota bacterium]